MKEEDIKLLLAEVAEREIGSNFEFSWKRGITEGWDSFNHVKLIIGVESSFNISFSIEEIDEMNTGEILFNKICEKTL